MSDDQAFVGNIPDVYDALMVPMIFAPYAEDLARRVKASSAKDVLELACGTGAVTRELAKHTDANIVATDLNPDMIAQARAKGSVREVEWRPADALALPFEDETFDAVVCQFGAMFFPDKPKGFSEARRVLRPGGTFIFNVWTDIEQTEIENAVTEACAKAFPDDPPRFLARTPHGYHDEPQIRADLRAGGFANEPTMETLTLRSHAKSARDVARAYCGGTPLAGELGPERIERALEAIAAEVEQRFGATDIDAQMQALLVSVTR